MGIRNPKYLDSELQIPNSVDRIGRCCRCCSGFAFCSGFVIPNRDKADFNPCDQVVKDSGFLIQLVWGLEIQVSGFEIANSE
jgi:hypothetical protein